jgi:hypothetical protein
MQLGIAVLSFVDFQAIKINLQAYAIVNISLVLVLSSNFQLGMQLGMQLDMQLDMQLGMQLVIAVLPFVSFQAIKIHLQA